MALKQRLLQDRKVNEKYNKIQNGTAKVAYCPFLVMFSKQKEFGEALNPGVYQKFVF